MAENKKNGRVTQLGIFTTQDDKQGQQLTCYDWEEKCVPAEGLNVWVDPTKSCRKCGKLPDRCRC